MDQKHVGSDFEDFLGEEGLLEEAEAMAAKRVIAFQVAQEKQCCTDEVAVIRDVPREAVEKRLRDR